MFVMQMERFSPSLSPFLFHSSLTPSDSKSAKLSRLNLSAQLWDSNTKHSIAGNVAKSWTLSLLTHGVSCRQGWKLCRVISMQLYMIVGVTAKQVLNACQGLYHSTSVLS